MRMKTFCMDKKKIEYQEIFADSDLFEKFYEIENPTNTDCIAIPDGGVDIQCLWRGDAMKIQVAGSFKQGGVSPISNYDCCFGGRFKRGVVPKCLQGHVESVIANRVPIEMFLEVPVLTKNLKKGLYLEQKADFMLQIFEDAEITEENIITKFLIEEIDKNRGKVVVSEMVESLGYSHRYIDHVFKNMIGMSVKKYAGIVRLQNSLSYLVNQKEDDVYEKLGYYDQAHFIHDFKRFTSFTPNVMKKKAKQLQIV